IRGRALGEIHSPIVGFILRDAIGQNLFGDNTWLAYRNRPRPMAPGDPFHAALRFRLPLLPLGTYAIAPSIIDGTQQNHVQLLWIEEALVLTVHQSPLRTGMVGVPMQAASTVRRATR
ncbi:MAG: Wzt carbohydrate-binding domain-containing protein, partial [Mesorhizobium sp.]|nr:Wzt carbohydrate-binding domain-containing protein [Mesorhizobium sp.]